MSFVSLLYHPRTKLALQEEVACGEKLYQTAQKLVARSRVPDRQGL